MKSGRMNFVIGMTVGGVLMGGGMLLGGMAQPGGGDAQFGTLRAEEIILTDYRGRQEFLKLRATDSGGMLSILDRNGKEVIAMGVTRQVAPTGNTQDQALENIKFTGIMDIKTSDNTLLMRSGGNAFGGFTLVKNAQGRDVVTIAAREEGDGVLGAHDRGGAIVGFIIGTPQGAQFQSQDRRQNAIWGAPFNPAQSRAPGG